MGCCASSPTIDSPKHDPEEKQGMLPLEGNGPPTNGHNGTTQGPHIVRAHDNDHNGNGAAISMTSNKKKSKKNSKNKKIEEKRYKIILLGAGMSGKTTLIKQMRKLHGPAYTQKDFMNCKPHLTANLIESFRKLCIYSDMFAETPSMSITSQSAHSHQSQSGSSDEKDNNNNNNNNNVLQKDETRVLPENKELREEIARLNDRTAFTEALYIKFSKILSDPGIQKTMEYRYQFQLNDNFDYLAANMEKYCQDDYIPTFTDYLHVKQRTVGIQKLSFTMMGKQDSNVREHYIIHDAGGQRNERKKWMHVINGARAFIFVAALSGYNQSLWEEPSYNRMKEAIHLFKRIYHMESLKSAQPILFLNKTDLFDKKLSKYSIKTQFPDYEGPETTEHVRTYIVNLFKNQMHSSNGYNNNPAISHNNSSSSFGGGYNNNEEDDGRNLYHHFTCATDTDCVNKVFELTRDCIVCVNLNNVGFI